MGFSLETKMCDIIRHPDYQRFLDKIFIRERILEILCFENYSRNEANNWAQQHFWDDSFRTSWNKYVLLENMECGKRHELDESGATDCPINEKNACCGHPGLSRIYHTVCVWAFLVEKLTGKLYNPKSVIRWTLKIDRSASRWRDLSFWILTKITHLKKILGKIFQNREKHVYEKIIIPFRKKVSTALSTNL